MITIFAATAALLLQAAPAMLEPEHTVDTDVAFEAIAEGRSSEAIERIEAMLGEQGDDPALLINLAAAYLQEGKAERAADCYRRAIASDERYRMELADGSWVDSRLAARHALEALETRQIAMR